MQHDHLAALSKVRLENAQQLLITAQLLMDAGDYKSCANRSYYAIFNAMRACLALHEIDYKRHSGVISDFRVLYIKTNKLPIEFSDMISSLFEMRNKSDYNDFYVVSKDAVALQLANAKIFVQGVAALLAV